MSNRKVYSKKKLPITGFFPVVRSLIFAHIPLSLDIHTDAGFKFHSVLIFVYSDLL